MPTCIAQTFFTKKAMQINKRVSADMSALCIEREEEEEEGFPS